MQTHTHTTTTGAKSKASHTLCPGMSKRAARKRSGKSSSARRRRQSRRRGSRSASPAFRGRNWMERARRAFSETKPEGAWRSLEESVSKTQEEQEKAKTSLMKVLFGSHTLPDKVLTYTFFTDEQAKELVRTSFLIDFASRLPVPFTSKHVENLKTYYSEVVDKPQAFEAHAIGVALKYPSTAGVMKTLISTIEWEPLLAFFEMWKPTIFASPKKNAHWTFLITTLETTMQADSLPVTPGAVTRELVEFWKGARGKFA